MKSLKTSIRNDAGKTIAWYKDNCLEANPEKFQCVMMGREGSIPTSIQLSDTFIETILNTKRNDYVHDLHQQCA